VTKTEFAIDRQGIESMTSMVRFLRGIRQSRAKLPHLPKLNNTREPTAKENIYNHHLVWDIDCSTFQAQPGDLMTARKILAASKVSREAKH
jgi:hypothetical protein